MRICDRDHDEVCYDERPVGGRSIPQECPACLVRWGAGDARLAAEIDHNWETAKLRARIEELEADLARAKGEVL